MMRRYVGMVQLGAIIPCSCWTSEKLGSIIAVVSVSHNQLPGGPNQADLDQPAMWRQGGG